MITYFEAPRYAAHSEVENWNKAIFLGGSITGAVDWQKDVAQKLQPHFTVFNPRRVGYQLFDSKIEREQIAWEYHYLNMCTHALFYFSHETLAPITLFEYGKQLIKMKYAPYRKTYVCVHPDYLRKNDVYIQTELEQPKLATQIFSDINTTIQHIIKNNENEY